MLDSRCKWFWLERIKTIDPSDPLIPAQGDAHSHWRTDNAVKAFAALYKDIGVQLEDQAISSMRSHCQMRVLGTGVPETQLRGLAVPTTPNRQFNLQSLQVSKETILIGSVLVASAVVATVSPEAKKLLAQNAPKVLSSTAKMLLPGKK
ncbi:hypothetical protein [Corynebacterium hiratae]|uniref:hypothetical protein n=1 Tax=Corynebacterium hiratae TaxID=3139423 RepID=UPI00272E4B2E|nr:hypothetical protein [Corynebacterium aurimucosum]